MRKVLCAISLAAATTLTATGAQAAHYYHHHHPLHVHVYRSHNYAAPVDTTVGVVGGTVVGVGVSQGWWGATAAGTLLPATAAGAATFGGVAGVGAVAAVDMFLQPCRGVQAMFALKRGACENGHYVGYGPRIAYYYNRHGQRVYQR